MAQLKIHKIGTCEDLVEKAEVHILTYGHSVVRNVHEEKQQSKKMQQQQQQKQQQQKTQQHTQQQQGQHQIRQQQQFPSQQQQQKQFKQNGWKQFKQQTPATTQTHTQASVAGCLSPPPPL